MEEMPKQDKGEGNRPSWMCPNSHVLTKLDILQNLYFLVFIEATLGLRWWLNGKELPADAGDTDSIPG